MNFATSVPYEKLIQNALILARMNKYDVYNCLNLMDNQTVFEELHFQKGDGNLQYYFYNWVMKCKHITPEQLGVVLFWWSSWAYKYLMNMNGMDGIYKRIRDQYYNTFYWWIAGKTHSSFGKPSPKSSTPPKGKPKPIRCKLASTITSKTFRLKWIWLDM